MRLAPSCVLVLGLLACKNDPYRPDAAIDGPYLDAPEPDAAIPVTWWVPARDTYKNWDIQLNEDIDLSAQREMYILDLFDVVPEPIVLDYGGGDTVTVPAGAHASAIATLHALTPPTKVVCRVATGAVDLGDPDASKFPGFEASPPDRDTPPKGDSVIGWSTGPTNPNERYLDIRPERRALWFARLQKRFDLAKMIGCDAIDPDGSDQKTDAGWGQPSAEDQDAFFRAIVNEAHTREISIAMHSDFTTQGLVMANVHRFDWIIKERCAEYNDCGDMGAFGQRDKAMFALDFERITGPGEPSGVEPAEACPRYAANNVAGIIKDIRLTKQRTACP
jgi:hypothetical protein